MAEPTPELRISLPARLDVLVALFTALQSELPDARVRHEDSDLVIAIPAAGDQREGLPT